MAFANDCLDATGVNPRQIKAITVGQTTSETKAVTLFDPRDNTAINLTEFGIGTTNGSLTDSGESSSLISENLSSHWVVESDNNKHGVEIVIKDMPNSISYRSRMASINSQGDAEKGIVRVLFDGDFTRRAGTFLAMAIIWRHNVPQRLLPFYYTVMPSLRQNACTGPLTIFEIRMAMRDSAPEGNFLLDAVEFKDEEIMWAISRPIEYWNEIPPPLRTYTTQNFPFRYHWMEATIGELYRTIAMWMRRNDLDYTAAGLSVQDTKKWPDYIKFSDDRLKRWQEFAKNKKIEMNIADGYATITGYQSNSYR